MRQGAGVIPDVDVVKPSRRGESFDVAELRRCLGKFATGVTVVTCETREGSAHGLTVNAFNAVSLEPPLVLVSVDRRSRASGLLADRPFAVNVLAEGHERLARHFAGRPDSELPIPWQRGTLVPRLAGALAYFECEPWRAYNGGDHELFLGRVVDFGHASGDALGFFSSRFVRVPTPDLLASVFRYDPFELPYDACE